MKFTENGAATELEPGDNGVWIGALWLDNAADIVPAGALPPLKFLIENFKLKYLKIVIEIQPYFSKLNIVSFTYLSVQKKNTY